MKAALFSLIFFFTAAYADLPSHLSLRVEEKSGKVLLHVVSEMRSSMCALVIDELEMIHPQKGKNGLLSLHVITDPEGLCLMAFGPHRGSFSFERGKSLPYLKEGPYDLLLNGVSYGILVVSREGILLL